MNTATRTERYLVSVTRRQGNRPGATRKFIWEGEGSLALDHPDSWRLERTPHGLRLRLKDRVRDFPEEFFGDQPLELPLDDAGGMALLTLRKAPAIRPAYLPAHTSEGASSASRLCVSSGARGSLAEFAEVPRKYAARSEARRVFVLRRTRSGYELTARVADLTIGHLGGPACKPLCTLQKKERRLFSEAELESLVVTRGLHWWRFSLVAERPLLSLAHVAPSPASLEEALEKAWFKNFNKKLAIGCVAVSLLLLILPKAKDSLNPSIDEPPPESTLVSLKKPKVIEKIVLHTPAQLPPQVAEPVAAPKKSRPPKRVAQTAPKKVQPQPVPAPPRVDEAALRAKQQADAKAKLAKSLNFLSTAPAKTATVVSNRDDARYKSLAQAVPRADGSPEVLSKLAKSNHADGPIQTEGARTMDSKVALAGNARSKGLNEVQGRVSLSSIASSNDGGAGVDSLLSSKGISVGGSGALAQSEIERALSKHLQRFQYCYEKALLTDSALAGHVLVQWTIGSDGASSDVKVLRSQLNNASLHQCLAAEISKVHFPAPQGGEVIVKYPFAFSSTAL